MWQTALFNILSVVPLFTLTPRFIVSIRELYARDVHCGRGEGIDTGFGLTSGRSAVETAIVFADAVQNEGPEDIEEVPREVRTTQPV